ncbi:glycosyltransferase family 4 protein [Deferribacterales bacterium Es71-Z0220]|jgi:glycosyltransferase involved in cell wall biosynthesis|uniref:glycosyltransferase family 4 protein n=1 Tax=Deferrivibrio essentukiensis TaxID=2880922 RepID=UPI001F605B34|nr:glycosyltransferase family 4 protein [Deferrivibrio essentukiensis]MBZ4672661.1 glycosyl transferase [Deferribacteraceae bacterium]MCB4205265.1 glycosyltransferase family 4 protein [Deferrivibrio essentukiensis]
MKFLQVINVRWYNATAWYAVNLSRILQEHGHKVVVLGLPGSPPIKKACEHGLEVLELNLNSNNPLIFYKNQSELSVFIKEYKPEIINCHRGEFFWWFAFNRFKNSNFKLIRTRGDQRKPSTDVFNKIIHDRWCDKIITSSNKIKNYYLQMGINTDKIEVIYGGVDTRKFYPDHIERNRIRKEFNFKEEDFVVGIVGRFDPVKGHEILIKAISHLYNEEGFNNIKLFIVGFDSIISKSQLQEKLVAHKIDNITKFAGFRDDIPSVLNSFDLGVVASVGSETICRVGMEIMACGVPLVVSNIGTLPELVEKENVYQFDNYIDLAEKIKNHSKKTFIFSDDKFYQEYINLVNSI